MTHIKSGVREIGQWGYTTPTRRLVTRIPDQDPRPAGCHVTAEAVGAEGLHHGVEAAARELILTSPISDYVVIIL
jgi:hypothetical protein